MILITRAECWRPLFALLICNLPLLADDRLANPVAEFKDMVAGVHHSTAFSNPNTRFQSRFMSNTV
jgi:hypothetical protein